MGQTTPKGVPQTPPSSTRKRHGPKLIPKFNLQEETPKNNDGLRADHTQLQTATVRGKSNNGSSDVTFQLNEGTTLFPPSPDFTPRRSPRSKRKKLNFESFLPLLESFSVLLPKHGTVGSGRKHWGDTLSILKGHIPLDLSELFSLNENLGFEEDVPESPTRRGRRRDTVPATPGKQLITEEKVRCWHGTSFRGSFSSDEDDLETDLKGQTKLANPFIDTESSAENHQDYALRSRRKIPFASKETPVNYETHMVVVNSRTGERKVQLLLEDQRRFKPKKIDFSGI